MMLTPEEIVRRDKLVEYLAEGADQEHAEFWVDRYLLTIEGRVRCLRVAWGQFTQALKEAFQFE